MRGTQFTEYNISVPHSLFIFNISTSGSAASSIEIQEFAETVNNYYHSTCIELA